MCEFEFIYFIILFYILVANLLCLCKTMFMVCWPHKKFFLGQSFLCLWWCWITQPSYDEMVTSLRLFLRSSYCLNHGPRTTGMSSICSKTLYVTYVALKKYLSCSVDVDVSTQCRRWTNLLCYCPGWWIRRLNISLGNIRFCKYFCACLYGQPILLMEACSLSHWPSYYRCS
jgi:hypothetical protein